MEKVHSKYPMECREQNRNKIRLNDHQQSLSRCPLKCEKEIPPKYCDWLSNWFFISNVFSLLGVLSGSLPPSPADSGVSDVDSSSSGNGQPICSDEIKARLGLSGTTATPNSGQQQTQLPPPPGTFLHPNFYHQTAPLRNLWNNRNVSCKYLCIFYLVFRLLKKSANHLKVFWLFKL